MTTVRNETLLPAQRSGGERIRPPVRRRRTPLRRFQRYVLGLDVAVIALVLLAGLSARELWGSVVVVDGGGSGATVDYPVLALAMAGVWLASLALAGAYDPSRLGAGGAEFKAVVVGSAGAGAAVAIASYLSRADLSRLFFVTTFALGLIALLVCRYAARQVLHRRRRSGLSMRAAVVVGGVPQVAELIAVLRREPWAGYAVTGVCVPDPSLREVSGVPVLGTPGELRSAVLGAGADSVLVTGGAGSGTRDFQRLTWQLEGLGVDLNVAPSFGDVAGPRVHLRPLAGLPLLHLELPEFTGPQRVTKGILDVAAASIGLVLLSPVLLGIALAIKLTSPGPVLFRQVRVGRDGREFVCLKFRTMVVDAEERLGALAERDEGNGLLFKVREDPRVTRVGRPLRRFSLDELPQLVNVVRREMSLVGPRPPLPGEVAAYSDDLRRRLRVRPGLTGLWQVSGRSDLSLEESTRLDLSYVDNWSLTHDVEIVWKTLRAVLEGRGAY